MSSELAALRSLVDRCLLLGFDGTTLPDDLKAWLAEGLGGVIVFGGNIDSPEQLATLTAQIHANGDDVLVAADEEGGDVTRLHHRDGCPYPGNLALGWMDDEAATHAVATAIGQELAAVGVNLDLAPVADVNTNPDNPIIGTRSFGSDPELVARHVVAYVQGMAEAGVAGCLKHFPGHGDTAVDSHLALPTIQGDRSALEPHLAPFRAGIAAGVPAVLSAHIVFPALDSQPGTLSRRILTGLLRDELGFDGAVVTDSLTMDAIAREFGVAEGAVGALAAGADLLCINSDLETHRAVRDRIVAAVRAGELSEARLVEAADRVRTLRDRFAPGSGSNEPNPAATGAGGSIETVRDRLLLRDASLPLAGSPYVVEVAPPRRGIELTAGSLLATMRRIAPDVDGIRWYARESADEPVAPPEGRPLVLVVRDAHRDPEQRAIIERFPTATVVGIGTHDDGALAAGRYLGTHGGARPNLTAAAEQLLGRR